MSDEINHPHDRLFRILHRGGEDADGVAALFQVAG